MEVIQVSPSAKQTAVREQITRMTSGSTGYSAKRLSQLLGVSDATISHIKNQKWAEVRQQMWERLYSHPVLGLTKYELSLTRNMRKIELICKDAQETCRMVAIAAYTGAGKTTAFEHITYAMENENVFYVLATEAMNVSEFLRKIGRSMGLELAGRPSVMIEKINERMIRSTKPLLIIDDAGKLSDACMRHIQIIYDYTKGYAGIVLGGTEYLQKTIARKATLDKRGFRELKRRVSLWADLYRPSYREIQDRCSKRGITEEGDVAAIAKAARWNKDDIANEADFGTIENYIDNLLRSKKHAQS